MNSKTATEVKARGLRQTMSELHIWTGLLVGWLLYAMFLTGTVSFFREEISRYMRPELMTSAVAPAAEVAQHVFDRIYEKQPTTSQISISLPSERRPFVSAFWRDPTATGRGLARGDFDAQTGQELGARETKGGDFFYAFHFNFHYMPALWGRWIAGLCAMFMLVAIVSGVITHKKIFVDFFTFRWGKGQRSWLDAHAALSVFGLPFHFMITWSGLVTLMVLYMPAGLQALPSTMDRLAVTSEMRFSPPAVKPTGEAGQLIALGPLVQQAEQRWGIGYVGSIHIQHPNDAMARVVLTKSQTAQISTTPNYVIFNGVTGELLQAKENSGPAATTQGVLYGLHLGRFADTALRWLYFLVSALGTAMVGSGLVLWTVKRRSKLANPKAPYFGFCLVERLNITAIAGLSVAMISFFWFNRLLPIAMTQRASWEIHGFFIVWATTWVWALIRPAKRAWVELFGVACLLFALLPIVNVVVTDQGFIQSSRRGEWMFLIFDLCLWFFAGLHGYLAWRTARYQPRLRPVRHTTPKPAPLTQEGGVG